MRIGASNTKHLTEVNGCTHWLQSVMDISVQMLMTVLSVSVLPIALGRVTSEGSGGAARGRCYKKES